MFVDSSMKALYLKWLPPPLKYECVSEEADDGAVNPAVTDSGHHVYLLTAHTSTVMSCPAWPLMEKHRAGTPAAAVRRVQHVMSSE